MVRIGIADCHGIESYLDEKDGIKVSWRLKLRADLNRQRHAVVFKAVLSDKVDKSIKTLLDKRKWSAGLKMLKKRAISIAFPEDGYNYAKSWKLIPNPNLDPWR